MKKAPIIVLTGGGSGGHITPLLSLAHALKKASPGSWVVYIGQKGEKLSGNLKDRYRVFDTVYSVPAGKFRRYHGESLLSHLIDLRTLVLNARDFFRAVAGIAYARKYLKRIKPDVVFSKGGFVAVPVGVAAATLKLPIVTHDSDAVPGLANRIVGRYAVVHATGMPAGNYDYPRGGIHYTGIPLDERIKPVTPAMQKQFKKMLGLPADSLVLLVGGAGLGAGEVNKKILSIAGGLLEDFPGLQIIHFAGEQHVDQVKAGYETALLSRKGRVRVLGFTDDFYKYTGAADLVISRAGATTIAELAAQKKPVILIPAPHLTGGHQLRNAEQIQKMRAGLLVSNDAPAGELLRVVTETLKKEPLRRQLADNLSHLAKPDAADSLATLLLGVAGQK
ncbi:glycosyltransferase [Candidatus Saccharibacteria bacterium]|nr:glycosyltransferase [Candidatus Saccharibacteria bacterium]